ncbi:MAG: Gfo/Idh/MocA family oxidoreductase [Propionibacteriaceae bacterium]|jgi:predicted dehydrogenase|nr:Gfo/Idh/MocA family oxidoreductase [Propionibacteriaceae bacterium]
MPEPVGIGLIGPGNVSGQYFDTFARLSDLDLVAIAGRNAWKVSHIAAERHLQPVTVDQLLADDDIALVVNLTVPAVHAEVNRAILAAGKHVYAEKPLALTFEEGQALVADAAARGLRLGCAPDTVLGTGVQTAAQIVRSGRLGEVIGATALWGAAGPELWHPTPAFYYEPGGGPALDMGPYYITALVHLLGPVTSVTGLARGSGRRRAVGTGPNTGQNLPVAVPTHSIALLRHASGAVTTVMLSFETWGQGPERRFEVYGTRGTLRVPDPNHFDGEVRLFDATGVVNTTDEAARRFEAVKPTAGYWPGGRGIGVLEMVEALRTGRPHRASGELALHVLEILTAIERSDGAPVELTTTVTPPDLVPLRELR